MPLYRGTITKELIGTKEQWVNTYTISEVNSLEAIGVLQSILDAEASIHSDQVMFIRAHVSNLADASDVRSNAYQTPGEIVSAGLGGMLPLFNTMRVVFSDGVKKPEQKYLRLPGYEANLENGAWSGELLIFVSINYVGPLLALVGFVGPSGEHPDFGAPQKAVQNRQLGWHRQSRPGFKRGWVPD